MSGQAFTFQINLDPTDLAAAARIRDWPVYWLPFQQDAITESLDDLETEAQTWMWSHFQNPTGRIENAFEKDVFGPWTGQLYNGEDYAQRTNYGFNGMTDSLGRYFQFWPGIAWAENAIVEAYPQVEQNFLVAFDKAVGRIHP